VDRDAALERAAAAGVDTIVCAGTDPETSARALALAETNARVWATVGIHPHEAKHADPASLERLSDLATSSRVVAIGEIGLDFHYDHSSRDQQVHALETQLDLADQLQLPIVVHSRDADSDTFAILSAWSSRRRGARFPEPFGVMHCYAYGPERLAAYAGSGLFISIPGIVTYPKADELQRTAELVGDEVLVIETDSPYLAPQSRRGRRNEPALLRETAEQVARLRHTSVEALAATTSANARRLFRLPS
jgi:TatD DNase family protein